MFIFFRCLKEPSPNEEMKQNQDLNQDIWNALETLPSQTLPKKVAKPIKRLTILAHELASDKLQEDAGKKAHDYMHKALDKAKNIYAKEIKEARVNVLVMEGKSLKTDLKGQKKSFDEFIEDADYNVINDAFRRAARGISPDLAKTYAKYLADKNKDEDNKEEALIEAHTDIAAIGLVTNIQTDIDSEADKLAKKLLKENKAAIKELSDERQETYRVLRSWSKDPENIELVKPNSWMVATTVIENDIKSPLPEYKNHLMCGETNKLFPCDMNVWETYVLGAESKKPEFIAWYRNPANASQGSLGIAYIENKEYHILRPDFIFFSKKEDNSIVANIVDPHGFHLSDSLPKLIGLAAYAETHGSFYGRIEAVIKLGEKYRYLDLTNPAVRLEINKAETAKSLYEGTLAMDY